MGQQQDQNVFLFSGVVQGDPEPLINERTKEVQGWQISLAQLGISLRFYVGAKLLDEAPKDGDSIAIKGVFKPTPSGWGKATSATEAKKLNGAKAAASAA